MKKLIFEDTTVIKKPFVEIDGVEYEVQDGEFDGGTDLNAQNFNQVQDNIEDYIDGETSMGSIIVENIECKNLFDINGNVNTQANDGSQVSKNSVSNGILTTQVNTWTDRVVGQKIENLIGKTITFSAKVVSTGTGQYGVIYIIEDGVSKKSEKGEAQAELSITYTCTSNNVVFSFATNTDSANNSGRGAQFTDIQVEIGDTKTDYVEHKNYSITSGSNENGHWIKYADGTMIQRGTIDKTKYVNPSTFSTTVQNIIIYRSAVVEVVFPQQFYSTDYSLHIDVESGLDGSRLYVSRYTALTKTRFENQLLSLENFIETGVGYANLSNVKWTAIGRWK